MKTARYRGSGRIFLGLLAFLWVFGMMTILAFPQPVTYGGVTFPQGNAAFADRVVAYQGGSCVPDMFADPRAALGPPDYDGPGCNRCLGCSTCAVSLGFRLSEIDNRGYLIVEFVDNRLVDVPGDDLFIYVTNGRPARVEISVDGSSFIPVGEAKDWPTGIDIAPYVKKGEEFRFVRISDVPGDEDRGPCPGPSIDAIGAMGPARAMGEEMGSLKLQVGGELALAATGAPKNLLIILDTSSSMDEPFKNSTKIEMAKQVLDELVDKIPDGTNVGLRIFGGCQVSRLIVPMGPINRAALRAQIQAIETGGPTPIAYALTQAQRDFANVSGPDLVVLVSDGRENCASDWWNAPVKAAQALVKKYKLKIRVVGFDVADQPKAREALKRIATTTGGHYFDAHSSTELRQALAFPTPLRYHVYNQSGSEVFTGNLAAPAPQLPAGVYRAVIDTTPPTVVGNVIVQGGKTTTITINRSGGGYSTKVSVP